MIILTPHQDYRFIGRDEPTEVDRLVVKETWVENVYQIEAGDFYESKLLIDIGANIGSVSIYAASLSPDIKVIAYEPENDNHTLLHDNIKLNDIGDRITVIKKAVSDKRGTTGITNQMGNSQITNDKSAETVEVITLDDVMSDIAECDILKIDVEGSECEIITGASDVTLNKVRYITLEFSAQTIDRFGAMVSKLSRCYNLHIIGSHEKGGQIYGRRY